MLDVVWLKRDVRLDDHGAFEEVIKSSNPFVVLYLYELDQLKESSVHGSHIHFVNEGLADLDWKLSCHLRILKNREGTKETVIDLTSTDERPADKKIQNPYSKIKSCYAKVECGSDNVGPAISRELAKNIYEKDLQAITLVRGECVQTLERIHAAYGIGRLLSHEETGHLASYERDKRVRIWCKRAGVTFIEYNQMGVTRCLRSRDDFSKKFNAFVSSPKYSSEKIVNLSPSRLHRDLSIVGSCKKLLHPRDMQEIEPEHRVDRAERQRGGETLGLEVLQNFLQQRGEGYSKGISSPNSSWETCSRLSPYLSWGHVSIRNVIQNVKRRQAQLKIQPEAGNWGRSLAAFLSRMHWRSHFIQKLESDFRMEIQDVCSTFQPMRRQPGDWNQDRYDAWSSGLTGFPFLDACMRCLLKHGWINFRMRAMIVSFACYNLWLDWKRIAPHLARIFLDFEPGIHYPQLQMQAGTTGINAMRVYSVTKQGKDQDPNGNFIRKYIPELSSLPRELIHEPWKMSDEQQVKYFVSIGMKYNQGTEGDFDDTNAAGMDNIKHYPLPIVDEKESAKVAKQRMSAVRKLDSTQDLAREVFEKHGSRNRRSSDANHPSRQTKKRKVATQSIKNFFQPLKDSKKKIRPAGKP